jgi:hypothetical protein
MRDTEIDSLSPKKVYLKKVMALLPALLCIPISARQERPCGVSTCSNSAHYCAIFNHSFNTKSLSFGVSFKFSVNDQVLGAIFTRLFLELRKQMFSTPLDFSCKFKSAIANRCPLETPGETSC